MSEFLNKCIANIEREAEEILSDPGPTTRPLSVRAEEALEIAVAARERDALAAQLAQCRTVLSNLQVANHMGMDLEPVLDAAEEILSEDPPAALEALRREMWEEAREEAAKVAEEAVSPSEYYTNDEQKTADLIALYIRSLSPPSHEPAPKAPDNA